MEIYSATARDLSPVIVNDVPMTPIEVNGERVVTLAMIDRVHDRPAGTARRTFNVNRGRLVEGRHYFVRNTSEAAALHITAPNGVTVMTERGYLMLVKTFTDELAWQVQDILVESYFTKPKPAVRPTHGPRLDVSREHRLTMKDQVMYAKMAGFTGNQALLAANRATTMLTGIDNLGLLGAPALPAPQNEALLAPTDIADRAGMKSGQAVNKRLCEIGLQTQHRDHKGHPYYEPTEAGIAVGATMQDVGKKHSDGTPVRQLRWASSVIQHLEEANGRHH